jgi:hypothetical protein
MRGRMFVQSGFREPEIYFGTMDELLGAIPQLSKDYARLRVHLPARASDEDHRKVVALGLAPVWGEP